MALKGTEKVTFEGINPASVMARDCRTLRSIDGVSERLRLTECGRNKPPATRQSQNCRIKATIGLLMFCRHSPTRAQNET
ncbi:MAG: hypothetical protein COB75_05305 [Idiomarina sp.]|nr:MAG: hypothetical protein COB75_05305 [Idiomarina sp.]